MTPPPVGVNVYELAQCSAQATRPDDPAWDGTDYAHPAWWRGNDVGCALTTRIIRKALDGKDDGQGVLENPELERVRRDVLEMRYWLGKALDALSPDAVTDTYRGEPDYLLFRHLCNHILRVLRKGRQL